MHADIPRAKAKKEQPKPLTPKTSCCFGKALFYENGKFSLGRFMLIVVFLTMISMWWCSTFNVINPTDFVKDNIHTIFLALVGYAGVTKFKVPISERLSGEAS